MKRIVSIIALLALVLSLAACGGSGNNNAGSDPAVTLVYAEVNSQDSVVGQTGTYFKEKVEELSGGSVTIDLQASGVLGSENDVLDAMLGGSTTIDISRISALALTSHGAQKAMLLSIPFTFKDRAHFRAFANSDLAPEFLNRSWACPSAASSTARRASVTSSR